MHTHSHVQTYFHVSRNHIPNMQLDTHTYTCAHARTHTSIHSCVRNHIQTCIHTHACTHVPTPAHTHTHIHTHTHAHSNIHSCVMQPHPNIHPHTYTHAHAHTHTHTHTNIHSCVTQPQVAAATSATMILATSLSATTVYIGLNAFSEVCCLPSAGCLCHVDSMHHAV